MIVPSVDQERLDLLRRQLRRWRKGDLLSELEEQKTHELTKTGWRSSGIIARAVYFLLTLVCVGATYGLLNLMSAPEELFTGVAALIVAEILIVRWHLFRAGPEEALYIAGLCLLILALPGPSRDEGLLLFAGAFLIAGVRVYNGLFLTIGCAQICVYLRVKGDQELPATFLAFAFAFSALALLNRPWRHPLWDRWFSWMLILMPLLAWGLLRLDSQRFVHRLEVVAIGAVISIAFLIFGLILRHHAPLIAGLVTAGLTAWEVHDWLPILAEVKFLLSGMALLIVALVVNRILDGKTRGVISEAVDKLPGFGLIEAAAASLATTHVAEGTAAPARRGDEGGFGGAGSSGEY